MNPEPDSEEPPEPGAERTRARNQALRALGRREQSAKELQARLAARGVDEACAEDVVRELGEAGWQSDRRYAELLLRSRIAQGYGPRRIAAELATRGVEDGLIREVLAEADCDWNALGRQVYRKRFTAAPTDFNERAKHQRFLAARGFDGEQIRAAMQSDGFDDAE